MAGKAGGNRVEVGKIGKGEYNRSVAAKRRCARGPLMLGAQNEGLSDALRPTAHGVGKFLRRVYLSG
jgi:hypothetical protein